MQGFHHQQQQLAALLSVALPKDAITSASATAAVPTTSTAAATAASSPGSEDNESSRLGALNSLHRAILYPPNSLLIAHSASFLAQGLSQLLSDKLYSVRQSAAIAYGSLCAVVSSIPLGSSGRQNHVMLGSLVERFISWALPLLTNGSAGDGTTELAVEGLREFLSVGDIGGIERYALPILKACQESLEDERTSLSLLHRLLGILTLISLKFGLLFQPHFLDIVDLLLGWALVPDLADSDRRVIMDSFLQFQKHWVGHLQFSLGLLSKFLGDMDVLLQDGTQGTPQQFRRLLALLSCFSTVLQATASGLLEINLLEQIIEPLNQMLPQLLGCLSKIGKRYGWSKWISDSWKCLTLLAEILGERFSTFYPLALDILFQSLELDSTTKPVGAGRITSFQVHGVLKTNLQLLSLQKLGLLPPTIQKILRFDSPISKLRLHPNHLVTGSSAATYIFLLQHGKDEIVQQAMTMLSEELELLKGMLGQILGHGEEVSDSTDFRSYSKLELIALFKFDLKVLLTTVSFSMASSLVDSPIIASLYLRRSEKLVSLIIEKLNPFDSPIQACIELQVNVIKTLERLSMVRLLSASSVKKQNGNRSFSVNSSEIVHDGSSFKDVPLDVVIECLRNCEMVIVKALHASSPLAVKVAALEWIEKFCENFITFSEDSDMNSYMCEFEGVSLVGNVVFAVLEAAFDKEPKVRSRVALTLELLLQSRMVHHVYFYPISEVVLDKLGDPDIDIRNAFVRLLSHVLPATAYACGTYDHGTSGTYSLTGLLSSKNSNLCWKQVFALKQLPQQLQSQQLVSVLSYISQRWKVPLSSWIQRLILRCRSSKNNGVEVSEDLGAYDPWLDLKVDQDVLKNICSVNNLAGAWWAIHEAARYCISTRLRTNLGGPTQTFAALERMLLDIAHVLELEGEQIDGTLSIIGSSGAHLLPMRLLLDFVEALKKNVYNAYEGSAILPPANRQSSLFFRANKKVCEEWFSRMSEPMMKAGLALQCDAATVQYCTLRLQELKNLMALNLKDKSMTQAAEQLHDISNRLLGDILKVLRHMALALSRSHESEALIGLQKWCTMNFSSLLIDEKKSMDQSGIFSSFQWITGLIYQAEGQYEKAAAYFSHLLQSEELLTSMGSDGVQFLISRIIENYTAVSDWKSLESWLTELQNLRTRHAGKSYSGALTTAGNEMNAVHALARFDEGDHIAAWSYLDLTPKSSSEITLDPKLALQRSEQMLLQALLQLGGDFEKGSHDLQKAKSLLEEVLSVLPLDGLAEATAYASQLHCIFALEESSMLTGNQVKSKPSKSILSSYVHLLQPLIKGFHQECIPWLKVLRVYRTISPTSAVTLNLCMNLMRWARKHGNLMLAHQLNSYLKNSVPNCSEEKYRDFLMLNLQYEGILLIHTENKIEDAFANLWSFVRSCMGSSSLTVKDAGDGMLKAKACLRLSDWLRRDCLNLEAVVLKMHAELYEEGKTYIAGGGSSYNDPDLSSGEGKPNLDAIIEEMVGTAAKLSTQLCPKMGKSWISYASWCFNQAKNILVNRREKTLNSCSFSTILAPELTPEGFKLTEDEIRGVQWLIFQFLQKDDLKHENDSGRDKEFWSDNAENLSDMSPLKSLVQEVVDIIEAAAGAPGAEDSNGEILSATVSSKLQNSLRFANPAAEDITSVVDELVDVWWSLRRRRVSLFGHAAHGFIQYLLHSSTKVKDGQLFGLDCESVKQKGGSYTLRATLYILHILLNYGVELRDTLEPALPSVPLLPWQEVTPQLFARLSSHPQNIVRRQLEGLLIMLAKRSPWSIVYPTLVDVNAYDQKPSEELQHILDCLRNLYPRLVQDVQLMINELGNVTVLWEELWLSTLQDLHTDVIRRINVLKEEAKRIAENATLSESEKKKINAAKYSAMMAPIVVALERRLASTSRKPETPHELWFHQEYREQLKSAILTFKSSPASAAALGDVWRPFDNIAASLSSYQRKSSISFGEVAPQLALLSSSEIPMPGLEKQVTISESNIGLTSNLQGIVTIASFLKQLTILSTKTKPKKLVMLGSDGKTYTYLLKGREDLRLDARIMQLLQAINSFLRSSSTTSHCLPSIRSYSVTPISGRAGLIQWVDNVISIYSIFRSWQNRVQLAQIQSSGAGNTKGSVPPPVPRPSDMFYGKIIPALKEKGIRRVISRRDWPHEVKRKVLLDLIKEVPAQLLHQELWCASEGFKAFSSKLKRYSGSVAAMSMVGHILGLGDRHLDNILMDFISGDVVHIDYNVCFDKGQRLKVPEIVPFRLTQTIEAALGLTGIEGNFRATCEAIISVLRQNKDILLMLLEVFVWDPLVEWTRGDFHDEAAIGGEERKGMELAVSLSLFASRVQEIRVPLQEHHDLLLATLPVVESALERFADVLMKYEVASALFYQADQEISNLILHETSAKSMVAEATSNSEKTRMSYEVLAREFSQSKTLVTEKAQEATTWIEQHGRVLDVLRSNLISEINASVNFSSMKDAFSVTSAVLVAGVPLTIVPEPTQIQCQDLDREVSQLVSDLDHGLSSGQIALQAYSLALQKILPLNYLTSSALHGWAQVLQLSANALSSDVISLARRQAAELIAKVHGDNVDFIGSSHADLCCKAQKCAVEIEKVEEECAELENSIGSESVLKAKDRLLSAFLKYMHSAGLRKEEAKYITPSEESKYDAAKDDKVQLELEEKKEKVLSVLKSATSSLYDDVKHRVLDIFSSSVEGRNDNGGLQSDLGAIFSQFEEQVEKCFLVADFVNELQQQIGQDMAGLGTDTDFSRTHTEEHWASIFKTTLLSCKSLVGKMTEVVLPDVMTSVVSFNTEVMDAFGLVSQIRGSIDSALEQLVDVEVEKASLVELEQNYFVRVGLIAQKQSALEEASMKGRDHLSWEEAEELASQEEACRAQLDQLHQAWNQRDKRASSLIKKEADIKKTLVSCEHHFQSLISAEDKGSKVLLTELVKPFSELESFDIALYRSGNVIASCSDGVPNLLDFVRSGHSVYEYIWNSGSSLNRHSFFIWKIGVLDSILDLCIHDVASYVDQSFGFEQLFNIVKRKLEMQLQEQIVRYLKQRVAPALLSCLQKENENSILLTDGRKELTDQVNKDAGPVKRVRLMLEEYCNAYETARATRTTASLMKRQVTELRDVLRKTILEIVQMEWMHDATLTPSYNCRLLFQKFFVSQDALYPIILSLTRPKLLESIRSVVSQVVRSIESLQSCERTSLTAEGQLERAMGWACGGPNTTGNSTTKDSGIPHEFHDHLMKRRQLLKEAREKASNFVRICMSVLEFEASRDGIFRVQGDVYSSRTGDDNTWQQAYMTALTKLEATYHSFTRTEQEWKLAQNSLEAASNSLYSATNELCNASLKAKSASGDLQSTVLAMRDCAYEASVALSTFASVARSHTALTSESGSMLEEVLAITEDLHDVHNLGKEAAALHRSLMEYLSKANGILLPLESVLSKDVATMTEAMGTERDPMKEVSPIHGQAIYQSYSVKVRETCQTFKSLVPSLTSSVEGLHALFIRLAQTASIHAGNLNRAIEGLGESQEVKSQEIILSGQDLAGDSTESDGQGRENLSRSSSGNVTDSVGVIKLSLQDKQWLSPPDSVSSGSMDSEINLAEANSPDSFNDPAEVMEQLSDASDHGKARDDVNSVPSLQSDFEETPQCKEAGDDATSSAKSATDESNEHKATPPLNDEGVGTPVDSSDPLNNVNLEPETGDKDESPSSNKVKPSDETHEVPNPNALTSGQFVRGKNAYALSVLKRVEMKLDGRDISDSRDISVAEQVDYLLKQATSVDNLCNMYEGWTPWI